MKATIDIHIVMPPPIDLQNVFMFVCMRTTAMTADKTTQRSQCQKEFFERYTQKSNETTQKKVTI